MSPWWCMGLLSCFGAAVVSVAAAETAAPAPLADSTWELVSLQSMDDAIGTRKIEDPTLYTLRLGADGNAAFRLNCNRGTASWKSSVSADGESGTIRFGPMVATRAMCPPPSLDEQLARDMDFVRSFLLRDGQLHLSLMADGGIYSWRPAAGVQESPGEETLGQAVRRALDGDYEAHYFSASIDLDGDTRPEIVVLVAGPMVCGSGGCDLMVFTPAGDGLRLVSRISVARPPVRAAHQRSHGWRNLVVHVGGGGAVAHDAELRFDGASYPANPTVPPATRTADAAQAEGLIPEFDSFREGKPVPALSAD